MDEEDRQEGIDPVRNVLSIASVTFREILRRKLQVSLLLFGALLILASYIVSGLTIGEWHRVISDLGLTAMQLIGILVAVFVGSSLVAGDIERRALLPVVAKPIARTEYLIGRFLGLVAVLLMNLLTMAALLGVMLVVDARSLRPIDAAYLSAVSLIGVQFVVVGSVAVFFSALTSTTLAAIFTLAIAIAGQLTNDLISLWKGPASWVPHILWYLLPNLGALNANESVIYRTPPPPQVWLASVYGLLYAGAALALASLAFEKRDLR